MPQPLTPEQIARERIDAMLRAADWTVQNVRQVSLRPGRGVAVRELSMKGGAADYALFLGTQLVGIIEAKRLGTTLGGVEAQTRAYASGVPDGVMAPITPLPFLYESTGVETWFTHGLDPAPRARRVFWFHRPETLQGWLDDALKIRKGLPTALSAPTLIGRMRRAPPLNTLGLRAPQISAIQNLERSVCEGRPRALVQMATGVGKTFTAASALYRLIKDGGARRALEPSPGDLSAGAAAQSGSRGRVTAGGGALRLTSGPVEENGQKWARKRGAFPANREHEAQEGGFVERNLDLEPQEDDFPRKIASMSLKETIFREKSRP